jgi:hypothetical protein
VAHIAGFVAAFGTGPSGEHLANFDNKQCTHRAMGLTSIARRDRRLPARRQQVMGFQWHHSPT